MAQKVTDRELVTEIVEENQEGLKRLAEEEPAAERRSMWKRMVHWVEKLFRSEEKVGHIAV